ncbi:MAG: hypothetical protein AAFX79_00400 [Planctomycetota bacterium]
MAERDFDAFVPPAPRPAYPPRVASAVARVRRRRLVRRTSLAALGTVALLALAAWPLLRQPPAAHDHGPGVAAAAPPSESLLGLRRQWQRGGELPAPAARPPRGSDGDPAPIRAGERARLLDLRAG